MSTLLALQGADAVAHFDVEYMKNYNVETIVSML
jgi:hypothetical protein